MKIDVAFKDSDHLKINHLILDLNGTIAIDGVVIEGVPERIRKIKELGIEIYLFTGDTNGNGQAIADQLGIKLKIAKDAEAKKLFAIEFDTNKTATIGNGRIDLDLFNTVNLSIAVIQKEGAFTKTLLAADLTTNSILDALDLFIYPNRMIASLRA